MFLLFQVFQESRHHEEMEEEPNGDHEQRGLDEEPPEALPVRMQRVQAETFRETPSTTERTVFKFRFHFRFVLLFAWLTRWPLIGVFPQN
jgi:hypothetical protein